MDISRRALFRMSLLPVAAKLMGCAAPEPLNPGCRSATCPSSRIYTSLGFEELAQENSWMYDAARSVGFTYDVNTRSVDPITHRAYAATGSCVLIDPIHVVGADHTFFTAGQFFASFRNPDGRIERRFKMMGGNDQGGDAVIATLDYDKDTSAMPPARVAHEADAISRASKVIAIGWIKGPTGKFILHASGTRSPEDILHKILPTTAGFTKGEPYQCVILAKMELEHGMSGGGLFSDGEVIGITKAILPTKTVGNVGMFTSIGYYTSRLYGSAPPPGCPDPRVRGIGFAPG